MKKLLNFSDFILEKIRLSENPCWKGYKQVGLKTKNGRKVPNCVPISKKINEEDKDLSSAIINRQGDVYQYKVVDDHWLAKRSDQTRWYQITGSDYQPAFQISIDILDRENKNLRSKDAPKKTVGKDPNKPESPILSQTPSSSPNKSSTSSAIPTKLTPTLDGKKVIALNWLNDSNFWMTSSGKDLSKMGFSGLDRNRGIGSNYDPAIFEKYLEDPKVMWSVYDITGNRFLAESTNSGKNIYGASVPKICVASAAFAKNNGTLPSDSDYVKVMKLLVNSDNAVWDYIGKLAGGDQAVNSWAKSLGFTMNPARRGGNTCNAHDLSLFWNAICRNQIAGSENIFKISSSCKTDASRARKFMPKNVYMGGKTGSWSNYNHDTCWVFNGSGLYAISVLTEYGGGGTKVIANLFRGLYDKYC